MDKSSVGIMLSAAAGAATMIGAVTGIAITPSDMVIALALGFSAGVMVTISLSELVPCAIAAAYRGGSVLSGVIIPLAAGMVFCIVMGETVFSKRRTDGLLRLGALSAAALFMHNLPEGIAVFAGTSADISLGMSLAAAILLHNIPEGVCIAMPVFASSKSAKKALALAGIGALAEPAGAVMAFLLLRGGSAEAALPAVLCAVAGLMICLAIGELLPEGASRSPKAAMTGALFGVMVMVLALSLPEM